MIYFRIFDVNGGIIAPVKQSTQDLRYDIYNLQLFQVIDFVLFQSFNRDKAR